jgi:hypothetical protein
MEGDLNDFDEFDSHIHASLGDLFPLVKKPDAPIVYIKILLINFLLILRLSNWLRKINSMGTMRSIRVIT